MILILHNDMKKYFFLVVLSWSAILLFAQDNKLEFVDNQEFLVRTKSYEKNKCKKDLNGNYCAVVEIELHLSDVSFASDYMVGKAEFDEGKGIYRLFVVPSKVTSSKKIKVSHKDYHSIEIPINKDADGNKLSPCEVYSIKLHAPDLDPNKNKETLVINTNVTGFFLTIKGDFDQTKTYVYENKFDTKLTRNGKYHLVISKNEYVTEEQDIIMTGTKNLNIQLRLKKGELTIEKEAEAEVYINGEKMGKKSTYLLEPGKYSVYTKLAGYASNVQNINLTRFGKTISIKLGGSLIITEPKDAQINIKCASSVDCLSPNTYRYPTNTTIQNLLGKYTVIVQKDDYETKMETVNILPSSNVSKSIHLKPLKHLYTYFGFIGSVNLMKPAEINSPIGISFGVMKRAGWYMNIKTSTQFWAKSIYQIENKINASKAENSKLRDNVGTSSYDITTGLLVNLTPKQSLYWYVGGGYGGYESSSDVFNYNISHGGEVESGLLCRIGRKKYCSFLMSVGYNLFINNTYQLHNIQCAIGIAFDKGVK